MPSPTASEGCEPHGDHWHCDGPVETGDSSSTSDAAASSATGSGGENAAGKAAIQISAVVGLVLGVVAFTA